MLPNIHLLGIQGSGKGTQSALLVEKYNLTYLASGNLFRKRSQINDEFGGQIAKDLQKGLLLSDEQLIVTIEDYLEKNIPNRGVLGDGVIRSENQYQKLQTIWTKFSLDQPLLVHFILDEETALQRIQNRREEVLAGQNIPHHEKYSGKALHRTDDDLTSIHQRFNLYHEMTEPVIRLFEKNNRCIHIQANQSITDVRNEILSGIDNYYPNLI